MASSLVFWICLFVGCTAVPMTVDMLRIFLPATASRSGRLVAAWQRPVLLAMVVCLCFWAYYAFWSSVLPYRHETVLHPAGLSHVALCTWLWVMSVWNYAACASVDPGVVTPAAAAATRSEAGESSKPRPPPNCRHCAICDHDVLHFDHHCPFTGGCVGEGNLRFFLLFLLHCSLGCGYAALLAWAPFRDCVLLQCSVPALGLVRTPPPSEAACVRMGTRSLLLLPALMLFVCLSALGVLHALLLANGLTTVQYVRRWRARGPRSLRDLLLLHGEAETDKWSILWGRPAASASLLHKLRVLALPSLPARGADGRIALGDGVGSSKAWLGAAAVLAALLLLLPVGVWAVEALAAGLRHATPIRGLGKALRAAP